jgi:hypothetical protein
MNLTLNEELLGCAVTNAAAKLYPPLCAVGLVKDLILTHSFEINTETEQTGVICGAASLLLAAGLHYAHNQPPDGGR